MELYCEWASDTHARKGRMISLPALTNILKLRDPGYSSLYFFSKEDADVIKENGHSRGFQYLVAYSAFLVMDIDCGQEGLDQITPILDKEGYSYEVWSSGGKGFHIYMPHEMLGSVHLPYSHKMKIREILGDKYALIDGSLYQHGRLLSLPGRIHAKTKKKKKFEYAKKGTRDLIVPIIEEVKVRPLYEQVVGSDEGLIIGLTRVQDMLTHPPGPGNRHLRIWGASKDLAMAGLSYDTVLNLMNRVNSSWTNQKPESEIEQAVQSAFKNW